MNPRLTRPLLALAISGALLAGSAAAASPAFADTTGPLPDPAAADTTAPVGTFTLNSRALWIGQSVRLTQGPVTDNVSAPEQVTRTVTWGDGTSDTLLAGTVATPHAYTRNGRFTITVTYTDEAGNSSTTATAVTITTPGTFRISKTSVWRYEDIVVTFSNVPAGTTKIAFDNGDGYVPILKGKNQRVTILYDTRKGGGVVKGPVTLRATFYNQYGASSPIRMGTVNVKVDSWRPVPKITKPLHANRLRSWKYVKGTATDRGAGPFRAEVHVTRVTGNKVYCYTAKRTWKRVTSDAQFDKYCVPPLYVPVTKGKWSLRLPGLAKGKIYIEVWVQDLAGNWSNRAFATAKITRS
ncbi:PKD domain-containing protein [Krasilnikovia sp. MM14-A1004]|uniref:PKD domain-containing protein n=1 Tax=Krasilnikovia sp. MM14-A1004 TaxID=3373541 RepID=UPI00399CCA4B